MVAGLLCLAGCQTDRRLLGGEALNREAPLTAVCYVRARHFYGFEPVDCAEMEVIRP